MKPIAWNENMSLEDTKNLAYWERNMLALRLATVSNDNGCRCYGSEINSGWYYDTDNNWEGWKRVISIMDGSYCFHIPDDFNVGDLPQIEPNWDGHSTHEKWSRMMKECGIEVE